MHKEKEEIHQKHLAEKKRIEMEMNLAQD